MQAQRIDPIDLRLVPLADGFDKGESIARDDGKAADKCMRAYAAELVHSGEGADRCVVPYGNMASKSRRIGHDDMVSHDAIVGHVTVCHYEIAISDGRDAVPALRSAIQADKLPKDIIVADLKVGRFPFVFKILGISSDGAVAIEVASLPDRSPTMDVNMGIQDAAGSYARVWSNDAIGTDFGVR